MKIFNTLASIFFSKEKEQKPVEERVEEAPIAALTYSINAEGEIFVDVNIEDFSNDTIDNLAFIVSTVSTLKCQLVTMEMIKGSFFQEGRSEEFSRLMQKTLELTQEATEDYKKLRNGTDIEEPCIKPSDML